MNRQTNKFHRDLRHPTQKEMKMKIKVTENMTKLETLYHQGKTGAIVQWDIWTEGADICTEYGQMGGKMQTSRKTATPKNVGRANATTAEEQAVLEAKAMHKKRLDGKYSLTIEDAKKEVFLPMLAGDFEKRKDKVTYPVDVQPKLDGVRCLAYWDGDSIKLMSRGGKQWECCDHIIEALNRIGMPKGMVLDGELYIHGSTFQDITKLVKKLRPESVDVEFHVYDVPRVDGDVGDWSERFEMLDMLRESFQDEYCLQIVPTWTAHNEEDVYKLQSEYLEKGYEGAIVRESDGEYRFGYRSRSLLKVKNFTDSEYPIVGFTTGVGRFDGSVVWICETWNPRGDRLEFKVVPQGTMEERQEAYQNADENIGDMLKVKYFELTADGVPRFPVGLGIRLTEDM